MFSRREVLSSIVGGSALVALRSARADQADWGHVRAAFGSDATIVNLNHAGVGAAPRVVMDAMARDLARSNQVAPHALWTELEPRVEEVRRRLAAMAGCDPEELAITRNASESLETCQLGLDLARGDEVVTTDHDYFRMIETWRQRERRDGIVLKLVPLGDDVLERFEQAITPRTRVFLFCHVTNRTGRVLPVARLCQLARQHGITTIVDGAQAFAHVPVNVAQLGCDHYATSLHKWLSAPHGTGFLYVRRERIPKLWPLMAAPARMDANVRKFEEIGTHPAANHNAIAEALTFHDAIGLERKAARLQSLRDRWTARVGAVKGACVVTHADQAPGIGLLQLEGADPAELARRLLEKHGVLVSPIVGGPCEGIRVSPGIASSVEDVDAFAAAIEAER